MAFKLENDEEASLRMPVKDNYMMEEEHSMRREPTGQRSRDVSGGQQNWDPVSGGGAEVMMSEAEEQVLGNLVGK